MRQSCEPILPLFRRVAPRLHDRLADGPLPWCARRVKLVNGSKVSTPDTPANQAPFPQQRGQEAGLDLRAIEQMMEIDVLRCLTPDRVLRETAVHVLAYNLVRALMCKAVQRCELLPRTLSFTARLQFLLSHCGSCGHRPCDTLEVRSCLVVSITHRVADRPARKEPGAVKRRRKAYPLLTKPGAQARAELRNH
jgi:hypothetical protein